MHHFTHLAATCETLDNRDWVVGDILDDFLAQAEDGQILSMASCESSVDDG